MLKLNSKNMFSIGNEDHAEESAKEIGEQGAVGTADTEEVVAEVTPEVDVEEAGDDIGQATPVEGIEPDDKADITSTEIEVEEDIPLEGATTEESDEVTELLQEGESASATKGEIVSAAITEATGSSPEGEDTDVNGNALTEEQAEVNDAEEAVEDEVDEEAKEESQAKDIHQEAAEADENATEELGDAIDDDTIEEGDDTPLDGAEEDASIGDTDSPTDESGSDDVLDDEADVPADDASATDDAGDEGESDPDLETTDVDTEVEDQNAAADVTAEAASADADQTEFIAGDTPEQHGDVDVDELVANDGEEVVAEAEPAVQNEEDVSTVNSNVEEDEDEGTPLEGAEELDVEVEEDLTPTETDGPIDEDQSGATVEESITDQTAEDLQEGVDDVAEATAEVEEDSGESTTEGADEEVLAEVEEPETEEVVEETTDTEGPDVEAGEVEETEEEANFDEGEVDVKDVDTDTTDEDVAEAMDDAAEVGEWGEKEEKDADLADKTIEELQKEKESLEEFRCLLEIGIATEKYQPALLAYKTEQMRPVYERFAKLDSSLPARVSLEDYAAGDMDLAYRASLESVRGVISRISTATHSISHMVEKWWASGMIDKVTKRADALDKQIDLSLTQLQDADYSPKDIGGIRGYLATTETNLVKAVADDLKITTDIAIKGIKASEGLQDNLVKALNDIMAAGTPDAIDRVLEAVANLKDTKADFPKAAFDGKLLGGYVLEMREQKAGDRNSRIEALGHNGIPVGVKANKSPEGGTYKLTKGDIANLLKMAKTYVALARKLANTTGDRAVNSVTKIRTTRDRALPIAVDTRVKGDERGVDATATAMKLAAKAHVDLYKFITKHCVEVADACCGVAKKAIK